MAKEVSAVVDNLRRDQSPLVLFARTLHQLDKCIQHLESHFAGELVDILLLIYTEHC